MELTVLESCRAIGTKIAIKSRYGLSQFPDEYSSIQRTSICLLINTTGKNKEINASILAIAL